MVKLVLVHCISWECQKKVKEVFASTLLDLVGLQRQKEYCQNLTHLTTDFADDVTKLAILTPGCISLSQVCPIFSNICFS